MARRRERGWAASVHAACGAPGGRARVHAAAGFTEQRTVGSAHESRVFPFGRDGDSKFGRVTRVRRGGVVRSNPFTPLPPTPLYTTQPAHKSSL